MNETDDAILEFFEELYGTSDLEVALPPTAIWFNLVEQMGVLEKSQNTISRRMNKLAEMGLLEKVDESRGYYKFTQKGRDYLAGNISAEDLEIDESS